MNIALKNVRFNPSAAAISLAFQEDRRRHTKSRVDGETLQNRYFPRKLKEMFNKLDLYSRRNRVPVTFTNVNRNKCGVPSSYVYLESYDVDIDNWSFSWRKRIATDFPCSQVAKLCRLSNINMTIYLATVNQTSTRRNSMKNATTSSRQRTSTRAHPTWRPLWPFLLCTADHGSEVTSVPWKH